MSEDKRYHQNLHPDVWEKISFAQRLATLQALEIDHAKQGSREPWEVKPVQYSSPHFCGKNEPKDRKLEINDVHIKAPALVCVTVQTVLHEGRHVYQRAAMKNNSLHNDKEQVRLWTANAKFYIDSDKIFAAYKFQPLERDAEKYAGNELIKIYSALEKQHGPIEPFRKAIKYRDIEFRKISEEAKTLFGADYIAKIDRAIMNEYQKQRAAQQEKTDPAKDVKRKIGPHNNIYRIDIQLPDGGNYTKMLK
jgi:hypothetical protein